MAAALLAGCESNPIISGKTTVLVPVAGGRTAAMTFGKNGPEEEENADFKVASILPLEPDKDKKHVDFVFQLQFKGDQAPRSVKVEDISEDPIMTLYQDDHPKLTNRRWVGELMKLDGKDKRIAWVANVDDTIRVLRFTVVMPDGRTSVLEQAISYPGLIKTYVRQVLGMGY